MSIEAIAQEFKNAVNVLDWENPNNNGIVALVEQECGSFTVVELDPEGDLPFYEDFIHEEEALAKSHFAERVESVKSRKSRTEHVAGILANLEYAHDAWL